MQGGCRRGSRPGLDIVPFSPTTSRSLKKLGWYTPSASSIRVSVMSHRSSKRRPGPRGRRGPAGRPALAVEESPNSPAARALDGLDAAVVTRLEAAAADRSGQKGRALAAVRSSIPNRNENSPPAVAGEAAGCPVPASRRSLANLSMFVSIRSSRSSTRSSKRFELLFRGMFALNYQMGDIRSRDDGQCLARALAGLAAGLA